MKTATLRRLVAAGCSAALIMTVGGCGKQTECMQRLGASNCTELFDLCQKSQTDIDKLEDCTECYNQSCQ